VARRHAAASIEVQQAKEFTACDVYRQNYLPGMAPETLNGSAKQSRRKQPAAVEANGHAEPPGANNPPEATTRLDSILAGGLAYPLSVAGFTTVLHLERYLEGHELAEIAGVGPTKADAIAKALAKWREGHLVGAEA
jgi:hypothetical protein